MNEEKILLFIAIYIVLYPIVGAILRIIDKDER